MPNIHAPGVMGCRKISASFQRSGNVTWLSLVATGRGNDLPISFHELPPDLAARYADAINAANDDWEKIPKELEAMS